MGYNQALGKWGEDLAMDYMISQGYEIIASNYRAKCGEVDIVATQGEAIVFCEVKTRTSLRYGTPASSVTLEKRNHIMGVAQSFLKDGKWENFYPRFDVIEIYRFNGISINHMIDAYQIED
jgi:putative endonuclease